MTTRVRNSESDLRIIQDRNDRFEKYLSELCSHMTIYTQKLAKIRDEGDALASLILQFAESEQINSNLRTSFVNLADNFSAVQDYRQAEIQRLEAKVINEIFLFGDVTQKAKDEIKKSAASLGKQESKRVVTRSLSTNTDTGLTSARRSFELQVDRFEQKKLFEIKRIMMDFVQIEMLFNVKAVEMLTRAHKHLSDLNFEEDLQDFRKQFNLSLTNEETMKRSPSHPSLSPTEDSKRAAEKKLRRFHSNPNMTSPAKIPDKTPSEDEYTLSSDDDSDETSTFIEKSGVNKK